MTAPTTEPAMPPDEPPARPGSTGLTRATAIIATIGVVVALLGIGLLLRPVETPTQDCGTALGFLLDGRVNELVSETDPPKGITPAEAKANNASPCRDRVADAAKPAAVLFGAGLVAALGATIVELVVRFAAWRRRGYRTDRRSDATDVTDVVDPTPSSA